MRQLRLLHEAKDVARGRGDGGGVLFTGTNREAAAWIRVLCPAPHTCVTVSMLLPLSAAQLVYLQTGPDQVTSLIGVLQRLSEITYNA